MLKLFAVQDEDEKIFKEEETKDSLFNWKYIFTLKNMCQENISQEFRLKNIDETRNYFLEKIK